jgi:Flp pilus assembly protein TadD
MAVRLIVCVLALAGAAAAVVLEHGARAADEVTALTGRTASAQELRHGVQLVRTARHVSPDPQPTLDLGIAEARARRFRAAGALFAQVARQEPRNARAWQLECIVARSYDSGLAATACARERALAPPVR